MEQRKLFTVSFECEVLTPMFLGSSNPRDAELRPPSIKGAMRFWWRAMNGHLKIEELREKEGDIFGSSSGNGSRSKVMLSVNSEKVRVTSRHLPEHRVIETMRKDRNSGRMVPAKMDAILFFAYGKHPSRDKDTGQMGTWADYIEPGSKFTVSLTSFFQDELSEAVKAFVTLAFFGGVGGKSKNGFGSFQILASTGMSEELKAFNPGNLIKGSALPVFPAFSSMAEMIENSSEKETWDQAIAEMALRYFKAKKKLVKTQGLTESNSFGNKKELVGMLLSRSEVKLANRPKRISKPFHMKIFKNSSGKYSGRILFLPSKFLEGMRSTQNDRVLDSLQKEFVEYLDLMVKELRK